MTITPGILHGCTTPALARLARSLGLAGTLTRDELIRGILERLRAASTTHQPEPR